jgi:hypothetical protein
VDAVLICQLTADQGELCSLILDRIARLVLMGDGKLLFVGSEPSPQDAPAARTIAVRLKSLALARTILHRWHSEAVFPPSVHMKLLQIEQASLQDPAMVMFP